MVRSLATLGPVATASDSNPRAAIVDVFLSFIRFPLFVEHLPDAWLTTTIFGIGGDRRPRLWDRQSQL